MRETHVSRVKREKTGRVQSDVCIRLNAEHRPHINTLYTFKVRCHLLCLNLKQMQALTCLSRGDEMERNDKQLPVMCQRTCSQTDEKYINSYLLAIRKQAIIS